MELTEKQWNWLMKKLSEPPTEEQKKMIREAVENGRKIKTHL